MEARVHLTFMVGSSKLSILMKSDTVDQG